MHCQQPQLTKILPKHHPATGSRPRSLALPSPPESTTHITLFSFLPYYRMPTGYIPGYQPPWLSQRQSPGQVALLNAKYRDVAGHLIAVIPNIQTHQLYNYTL